MAKGFVKHNSIVKEIWGKSDTILFIFAGAAAEFALNKAVDWLYYTGKLPQDPLGRLFSTVKYARRIVFAPMDGAHLAIDAMSNIHANLENKRGYAIPDWAYRDVLFMLIHYSIASYELLERNLNEAEKEEVYNVFYRVGDRMGLKLLPSNYIEWLPLRESHLQENLEKSEYTSDLFKQYKKHLGAMRYKILVEGQKLVIPGRVKQLLNFSGVSMLLPFVPIYKLSKSLGMDGIIKDALLPSEYKAQIKALDVQAG
ncbi:oxygenase MpaB family protein [Mangrovimonas aestuarii]|uniref:oxygenase MpaB family protein n=1 Tax=Mangrovimonas aestuarii TaxID=3018443 RepID=UPI002379EC5D|nr:oxygenase MpaB family protein [Mangrovimonas aestuarii]